MTSPHPHLADHCEWWPVGEPHPCYGPATFVLVRPGGATVRFACRAHREAFASGIRGPYAVLTRDEWEARGSGYRGVELGG